MEAGRRVLFVSYDGVLGGPGRSQTLPYLDGYRRSGWEVRLLSYEKPDLAADTARVGVVEELLGAAAIPWTRLPWRRSPLRDLATGLRAVGREVEAFRPSVLHARSYVPALLCDLAGRKYGAKLLFDMRGLWPDERVDGGLWSRGHPMYRLWLRLERRLLRRADGVVTLTANVRDLLLEEGLLPAATPVDVIPCGADLDRFSPGDGEARPAGFRPSDGNRVWTFLGATGTWYLLDEMLDFAAAAVKADPDARLLFLTEDPHAVLAEGLARRGVDGERFLVTRVPHDDVPAWITGTHAGVFFIRRCRSKRASCPTKLAEFLGCGVPVVVNAGVGDMDSMVGGRGIGVVVPEPGDAAFAAAREGIDALHAGGDVVRACRDAAGRDLDAAHGAGQFAAMARRLAGVSP